MKKAGKMLIYQVLPRLFGNDNETNTPNGGIEENGSGKFSAFSDSVLSEIQAMGFSHIWYTGILEHATKTDYTKYGILKDHPAVVKGNAGSPYAIKDYYDVDPDLADDVKKRMAEFEALVTRSHQAGLQVIIDFVPNHVARQYHSDAKPKGVKDLGEMDNKQTTYDVNNNFYYIPGQSFSPDFDITCNGIKYEEDPAKATGNDQFNANPTINDWYETVKLNYGIDYLNGGHRHFDPAPDTWLKMRDILLFWASKKVDAFRCDMAEMVPVEFWGWVIPLVKEKYPEIEFIAEVYNPDQYRNYIWNGKFDYLYDKVGLYDTLRAITCGQQGASSITACWQAVNDIQPHMVNFLENHDEQRIASDFFVKNPWVAIPALIVMATMNANPVMIYFGQELGEKGMDKEGFSGVDGRTTIFDYWCVKTVKNWRTKDKNQTLNEKTLRTFYSTLLNICNSEKSINKGIFYDLTYANYNNTFFDPGKQYAFIRKFGNELILIVVNFGDASVDASVFIPAHAFEYMQMDPERIGAGKDLLTGDKVPGNFKGDDYYEIHVEGHQARMLKFKVKGVKN